MSELSVFIGYDPRQPLSFTVLAHSIMKRASSPVQITRLQLNQLPITRKGLTEFTFSRYLAPHLCGYRGRSVFLDADMLCLTDITKIEEVMDPLLPVSVSKNTQTFEWPSLMAFNNAACASLTPQYIDHELTKPYTFEWARNGVGELPPEWNHLVMYDKPRPDAKIVHFTAGIPCWPETAGCEYAKEWTADAKEAMGTVSWETLMGNSVHRGVVAKHNKDKK